MKIKRLSHCFTILGIISCLFFLPTNNLFPIPSATTIASAEETSETIQVQTTGDDLYAYAFEVLEIVNKERTSNGLSPVEMDSFLLDAAMQRAAETSTYWSHTRPNNTSCFSVIDWRYTVGENIAAGYRSPEEVMIGWMNSPGHKANILNSSFESIGIGCYKVDNTLYWVQLFDAGTPRVAVQTKDNSSTYEIEISKSNLNLKLNLKEQLTVGDTTQVSISNFNTFCYSPIFSPNISFSSSNEEIATVSEQGNITAINKGTTTIKVLLSSDVFVEATITVNAKENKSTPLPNASILKISTPATKKIKLTWKKNTGITGYEIQYSTTKSFSRKTTITVANKNTTSTTITNLRKNTIYYVRLRTYKTIDKKNTYGSFSTIKSIITK